MKFSSRALRSAATLLGGLALSAASQSAVFGLGMDVVGAQEVAGSVSGDHRVAIVINLYGGNADDSGGDGNGNSYRNDYTWQIYSTTGSGNVPVHYGGTPNTTTEPSSGGGYAGRNTTVSFSFPLSTVASPSFKVILMGRKRSQSQGPSGTTVTNSFEEETLTGLRLRKFALDAAAIDSRKTYAPPNKDGTYPAADANAEQRHVGFAGWTYRGGLFVGNANGVNSDQSGVARIQCQATDPGSVPSCIYTLSILHIGTPSFFKQATTDWDASFSLRPLVAGASSGPVTPIGDLTWATSLDPATCSAGNVVAIPVTATNQYVNLQLGGGALSAFPARILLTASDDPGNGNTNPGSGTASWRYFAGSSYAPPSPTAPYAPAYPYTECAPHLWGCDAPGGSNVSSYPNLTGPNASVYPNSARWSFN